MKLDFEKITDPTEAAEAFERGTSLIDRKISELKRDKRLYTEPKVMAELEAARLEYAERQAAWTHYQEKVNREWLAGGFDKLQASFMAEEKKLDAAIQEGLSQVKTLCRERGRLAAKRRAANHKWSGIGKMRDEDRAFWRQMDEIFLGSKLQLPGGTLDEVARGAERQIMNIAAGKVEW